MSFANILLVLTLVTSAVLLVWNSWPTKSFIKVNLDSYYDYVIVGGGTAGCVLAARLSEDPSIKVALLEAGGEETGYPLGDIPHSAMDLVRTSADWAYQTQPQNHSCLGLRDRKSNWPRGKVLGGSSFISWMSYTRGNQLDYDRWAEKGAKGWSYEDVLPYFKLSENNKNKEYAASSYHGDKGPLTISDSMAAPKLTTAFKRAARELGYKVGDVNGKNQFLVNFNQMTAQYGKRMSTATAYLRPAIERKNLHVLTGAVVTRILFKERRAIGVEYRKNDTLHKVHVKKEVILSSGTVGSAKLLMLSGVGPKEHLTELGIDVLADLPVGTHLVDQVMTDGMVYQIADPVTITNQKAKGFLPLLDYLVFGSGLLVSTGIEGVGFFQSNAQPEEDRVPYLQIMLFPSLLSQDDASRKQAVLNTFNHVPQHFNEIHSGLGSREGLLLIPVLLHPKSNGTLRLASKDPHEPPVIQPNYLSHEQDVNILLDGIRLSQTLMETKAMKRFGIKYHQRVHPGCTDLSFDSDAYWQCYIRHNTLSAFNPVGTCRMGAEEAASTVVTPELRVKGVRHLRVVDASVIPSSMSGGTIAATVMIAERAADMILGRDRTLPVTPEEERIQHLHEHHGEL